MSIDELVGGAPIEPRPAAQRGVVMPTPAGQSVRVQLHDLGSMYYEEIPPAQWTGVPATGAECLVVYDDEGDAWGIVKVEVAAASGDKNYVHTQGPPSATWVVVHGLGKFPSVDVVDTGDSVVIPSVHYDSLNQVTLTFGSPTSGKAYVN